MARGRLCPGTERPGKYPGTRLGRKPEFVPTRMRAGVTWTPSEEPVEGTELKAATFHQLTLEERGDGYEVTVYFDV